jgi:hypothetical protein
MEWSNDASASWDVRRPRTTEQSCERRGPYAASRLPQENPPRKVTICIEKCHRRPIELRSRSVV